MVIELSKRLNEFVLSTPTQTGTTSTLIDASLAQYFPVALGAGNERFLPWVYGTSTADANNVGVQRRASAWNPNTLTIYPFPQAITTGSYEIHLRTDRTRKVEALNDAIGQLGLSFVRPFVDTSITTATNTWAYTIPSSINLARLYKVETQLNASTSLPTFPYVDGELWNWTVRTNTSLAGVETNILQFGTLPPQDRILRLEGEAYIPDLVNDSDVLPISGKWERPARTWIYQWAQYLMWEWFSADMPATQATRYTEQSLASLQKSKEDLLALMPGRKYSRLIVPGKGTGQYSFSNLNAPGMLASLHGAGS